MQIMGKFSFFILTTLLLAGFFATKNTSIAQELHNNNQGEWKARVIEVLKEEQVLVPGTEIKTWYQKIKAEILEGEKKGSIIEVENDFVRLKKGDKFFVNYLITVEGRELYLMGEPYRLGTIYFFITLFIAVVIIFGGKDGFRSLFSLFGSFAVIILLMLPILLKGYSPTITIVFFASVILALSMYITHGWNRVTHSAFIGTFITIVFVIILSQIGVNIGKLSGFASDEALYLNINSNGMLNISGLLLGAIIIGVLGILDDISITQSAAVKEFFSLEKSKTNVYKKALKIGKEHVGALVNTLALAYTGASLPLLLLFYQSAMPITTILNREIFATEIIRTIVGSIGLILAVPISTAIAIMLYREDDNKGEFHHYGHKHSS